MSTLDARARLGDYGFVHRARHRTNREVCAYLAVVKRSQIWWNLKRLELKYWAVDHEATSYNEWIGQLGARVLSRRRF